MIPKLTSLHQLLLIPSKLNPSKVPIAKFSLTQKYLHHSSKRLFSTTTPFTPETLKPILSKLKLDNGQTIMQSNMIQSIASDPTTNKLTIFLELDQNFRKAKSLIIEHLKSEGIDNTQFDIKLSPKSSKGTINDTKKNLSKVKHIVAVSSCKGGVGKSTIAINLAFTLSHFLGKKVGIFDSDIYGPSIPTLLHKKNTYLQSPPEQPKDIIPIEFEGVKAMSYGWASNNRRAVMRGPMVSGIVAQLFQATLWGELDYLIVDMPPGTGDVQITLGQEINFSGAVIVTTPQQLAYIDVIKGMEMFDDLKVPTLSIVENMAYFKCDNCDEKHYIFGKGATTQLINQFGIKNSYEIPLLKDVSKYSDLGSPTVLVLPENDKYVSLFKNIANGLDAEQKRIDEIGKDTPHVRYETGTSQIIVRQPDGKEKKIQAKHLREKCQCALCVDEFTGAQVQNKDVVNEGVFPARIEKKGNYAVAVVWSDGHKSSIYPYETLLSSFIDEQA